MWSPLLASAPVVVSLPASLRDKPCIWPGEHQGDVAVAEPADDIGRGSVGVIQADDLADAMAFRAIRDQQVAYLGSHGALPLGGGALAALGLPGFCHPRRPRCRAPGAEVTGWRAVGPAVDGTGKTHPAGVARGR